MEVPSIQQLANNCKLSYAYFCQLMQDDGWFDPTHKRLCDWIQYWVMKIVTRGDDNKDICRLLIVMPRGSLKTTIISKYLPIWLTLQDPDMRTLVATNTHTNACKKLEDIRGVFDRNTLFKQMFPELLPKKGRSRGEEANRWTNEAAEVNRPTAFPDATFEAAGVGTKKIGSHYNLILEDDTLAPDESKVKSRYVIPSTETVEKVIGYHKSGTQLLVPKGTRLRIVVTTRWCEFDLVDYIHKQGNFHIFDMPAMSEVKDPDTNVVQEVCNFSMFYSKDQLQHIRKDSGEYLFSCMYLNKPTDPSLRTFNTDWFIKKTPEQIPELNQQTDYVTIAVDPAISEDDDACESAITVVKHIQQDSGLKHDQYWVADYHGHWNPQQVVSKTLDIAELYLGFVRMIIVETIAFQKALKYEFYNQMADRLVHFPIVDFTSRQKKEVRIEGVLVPLFSNKRIYLSTALTEDVESQLIQFPHGRLVDVIDSFSMHVKAYQQDKYEQQPVQKEPEPLPNSFAAAVQEIKARAGKKRQTAGFTISVPEDLIIDGLDPEQEVLVPEFTI